MFTLIIIILNNNKNCTVVNIIYIIYFFFKTILIFVLSVAIVFYQQVNFAWLYKLKCCGTFSIYNISDNFRFSNKKYLFAQKATYLVLSYKTNLNVRAPLFCHILQFFNPIWLPVYLFNIFKTVNNDVPKWTASWMKCSRTSVASGKDATGSGEAVNDDRNMWLAAI